MPAKVLQLPTKPFRAKPPRRTKYSLVRTREYLTSDEVERVIKASRVGRCGARNALMLSLTYHHGLRVSELLDLRWDDIDWKDGTIFIRRLKGSTSNRQPILKDDLRGLRRLEKVGQYIFLSTWGSTLTRRAMHAIISNAGKRAGITFPIHMHCLRHSAGFYMANKGVDTRRIQELLGHKNIQCTVRYTELSPRGFIGLWDK